jgi:predicted nicotinamide N-methyase
MPREPGLADTVLEHVEIEGRTLAIERPRDAEALLDEEAFEHEEFLPYWAELWPSGVALASHVATLPLARRRVLELGCGLGLPSIVSALAGADALATDWSIDGLAFTQRNAGRNGARLETLLTRWDEPGPLVERGPFDLVLAADVLYERRNAEQLLSLLPDTVGPGGSVLLADPGRVHAGRFLDAARDRWAVHAVVVPALERGGIYTLTLLG